MNVKACKACFLLTSFYTIISIKSLCHSDFCASSRGPENTLQNVAGLFLREAQSLSIQLSQVLLVFKVLLTRMCLTKYALQ